MSDKTLLGLPVAAGEGLDGPEGYTVSPYAAIAIVRGFDNNQEEVHAIVMSDGMSAIEAAGLLHFGTVAIDEQIKVLTGAKPKKSKSKKK